MEDKKILNSTEEQLQIYERFVHEKNRKRIQWGIRVLLFGPLLFVAMMMLMDSNKNIYLLLWIVSLFGLSAYLISIEYMDYQMQSKLRKLGVPSGLAMSDSLISIGASEEDEKLLEVREEEREQKLIGAKMNQSFLPLKQLREDWIAVSKEEEEEEARIEEMIEEQAEQAEEAAENSESIGEKNPHWADYDFDPYAEEEDTEDEIDVFFDQTGNDKRKEMLQKEINPMIRTERINVPIPKKNDEISSKRKTAPLEGQNSLKNKDTTLESVHGKQVDVQMQTSDSKEELKSLDEQIEALIRKKIEAEVRAKVENEMKEKMNLYIEQEMAKYLNAGGIKSEKEEE